MMDGPGLGRACYRGFGDLETVCVAPGAEVKAACPCVEKGTGLKPARPTSACRGQRGEGAAPPLNPTGNQGSRVSL